GADSRGAYRGQLAQRGGAGGRGGPGHAPALAARGRGVCGGVRPGGICGGARSRREHHGGLGRRAVAGPRRVAGAAGARRGGGGQEGGGRRDRLALEVAKLTDAELLERLQAHLDAEAEQALEAERELAALPAGEAVEA